VLSSKNAEEVFQILRKELMKIFHSHEEAQTDYRLMILEINFYMAENFPIIHPSLISLLNDHLLTQTSFDDKTSVFVKNMLISITNFNNNDEIQSQIVGNLIQKFPDISNVNIIKGSLWVIGSYCPNDLVQEALGVIIKSLGSLPLEPSATAEDEPNAKVMRRHVAKTTILPDGTYSTQIVKIEECQGICLQP